MAAAGFEYARPVDVYLDVETRFAETASSASGLDDEEPADGEGEAPVSAGRPAGDTERMRAFDELAAWERTVAVADVRCDEEHRVAETLRTVRHEYEAAFVETHAVEIESVSGG